MARIRTIKPDHWNDKQLATLSLQAHLLWIGTWNFSDDDGVFENDPILLKSQIFPRRTDVRVEQVSQWLDQLVKARYILPFDYQDQGYYIHRTFKTHQKIDRPQKSKIPSDIIRRTLDECSTNARPCRVEESKGEDSKGKEREAAPIDSFKNPFSEKFLEEWEHWKVFKKQQFKFEYKGTISEQAAINELVKLANGNEEKARAIIHQSISKGWKGLFELKIENNGSGNNQQSKLFTGAGANAISAFSKIDSMPG